MSDEIDVSILVKNPEWDLLKTKSTRNEVLYECCPEPYLDVTYILYIRRKPQSYVNRILIPSLAITLLSLMGLMIPPTSPTTRFLFLFILFILMSFTTSVDLPEGCIIANLLCWCHIIMFSVLIYSNIVTAITNSKIINSKTVISRFFRSIIRCL